MNYGISVTLWYLFHSLEFDIREAAIELKL